VEIVRCLVIVVVSNAIVMGLSEPLAAQVPAGGEQAPGNGEQATGGEFAESERDSDRSSDDDTLRWGERSRGTGTNSTADSPSTGRPERFQPIPAQPIPAQPIPANPGAPGQPTAGRGAEGGVVGDSESNSSTDATSLPLAAEPLLYPATGVPTANQVQLTSATAPLATPQDGAAQLEDPIAIGNSQMDGFTRVTKGTDQLPNDAGQVWREYDISPYTYNITNSNRPQQAIIDWILKETGHELWFNEPLGILSATRDTLRVYHTAEIQSRIKSIVDRFNRGRGRLEVMSLRLVTINNPSWRSAAFAMMQPFPVGKPGVEGWLLSKEHAAMLMNELSRRNDFRQQSAGDVVMHDGQPYNLSSKRPISFSQSVQWVNSAIPYVQPVRSQIEEGFSLDFSSLSSLDGETCEIIIDCQVDQIEGFKRVTLNAPTSTGQVQPLDLQVPQLVSWNVNERFRWPSDKVLLLSCGVVATPAGVTSGIVDMNALLGGTRGRADALFFIEYKGAAASGAEANPAAATIPLPPRR